MKRGVVFLWLLNDHIGVSGVVGWHKCHMPKKKELFLKSVSSLSGLTLFWRLHTISWNFLWPSTPPENLCHSRFFSFDLSKLEWQSLKSHLITLVHLQQPIMLPTCWKRPSQWEDWCMQKGGSMWCMNWTGAWTTPKQHTLTHTHFKTLTHFHPLYVRGASSLGFSRY